MARMQFLTPFFLPTTRIQQIPPTYDFQPQIFSPILILG